MLFENFDPHVLQVKKIVLYWTKKKWNRLMVSTPSFHITHCSPFSLAYFTVSFISITVTKTVHIWHSTREHICVIVPVAAIVIYTAIWLVAQTNVPTAYAPGVFFFSCTLYRLVYVGGERINMYKHQRWSFEEKRKCVLGHGAVRNINVLEHTCSILWMTKCLLCVAKHISCGYDGKLLGNVSSTVSKLAAVKCTWKTKASKFYFFQL